MKCKRDTLGMHGVFQGLYSALGKRLLAHYAPFKGCRLVKFSRDDWPDEMGPPFLSAIDVLRTA